MPLRHSFREFLPFAIRVLLVPVAPLDAALPDGEHSDVFSTTPYFDLHGLFSVALAKFNGLRKIGHDGGIFHSSLLSQARFAISDLDLLGMAY